MIYTDNYNIPVPEGTDAPPDIEALHESFEIIDETLCDKVDKVTGKGLSTNDYDNTEKEKVANATPKSTKIELTLASASWTAENTYIVSNASITSATQPIELLPSSSITQEQLEAIQGANIVGASQSVGSVTFKAFGEKPTINIPVVLIIRGDL